MLQDEADVLFLYHEPGNTSCSILSLFCHEKDEQEQEVMSDKNLTGHHMYSVWVDWNRLHPVSSRWDAARVAAEQKPDTL